VQLFDGLSTAALTWVPPSVYQIEVNNENTTGADSSGSSGMFLMNPTREA
jgi:hypothetical protein